MKIKKLEIQGFKSFVDKTSFIFPKGITAIVGPNGCGKSNIVDVIRWVLGEQNARHLRGKLMEDVIFNGSESRKPVGMAEAVLTLSNEEGAAPAEYANFTEIEIARRLYRSGESEYYINKVQCRLKDIVDLFTDTGIGTKAYSIIEQGQVGWLVNAKPDERRALFEEAAGINKYKHRKDAALRRIEATKQNLTRVNDIIGEVKRQMNSMNRQAKKAERYRAMREELKGFELFLSSEEHKTLKERKSEDEKRLELFRMKELELSTAISQKESSLEEARTGRLKEETALKTVRQKVVETDNGIKEKERELQLVGLRQEELKRNEERFLREMEELRVQQDTVQEEIEGLSKLFEEMRAGVEGEGSRLLNEENILKEIEKRGQESGIKLQELRKGKEAETGSIGRIKSSIEECLRDEDRLNLISGRSLREKEELAPRLTRCEMLVTDLRGRKEELSRGRQNVERTQELTVGQLKELGDRLTQKDNELKGLKEELSHTSSRLYTLKELEKNLKGFQEGVRAIMLNREKDSPDYKRIHGLVADVIETSPQYEKAVEAVLGERLQYVIVESHQEGVEAVEYLKASASGRGSFLPLRSGKGKNHDSEGPAPYPDTQRLINHVRVKDGYNPIAQYLFGDVLLVNNLNNAIELWKSNGADKTFVTFDGEIVDAQGVITGGYSNGSDGGTLQKRREMKDLSVAISDLERKISGAEEEIGRMRQEAETNQKNLDGLKKDSHLKEIELVSIEAEVKREEAEMDRMRQRMETLEKEIGDARDGLGIISARKAQLLKERESVEEGLKRTENAIEEITVEVEDFYKKKDELSGIVTDIKVKLASSKERLEGIKEQIMNKKAFVADIEGRMLYRQAEVEKGRKEMAEHEGLVAGVKAELEDALKAMDGIRREEVRQEELLNRSTEEANQLEEALNGIKKTVAQLHDDINSINIDLKEIELTIGHLVEKMIERYAVALDGYIPSEDIKNMDREMMTGRMNELRAKITELGEVSLGAIEEYKELETRHQFLLEQQADLNNSIDALHRVINRINRTTRQRFKETFDAINLKFQDVFPKFFRGGRAELRLVDEGDLLESGIEIVAQPPGKRLQNISLLSGGEKALTAISLIFSIFLIKPSPFCLLDEVDAPLDDANIGRFNGFLKEMARKSQFLLITHNKGTMEIADTLFGVTMEEAGVSKIVSVQLS